MDPNAAFSVLLVIGGAMGARKGSLASLVVALACAGVHAKLVYDVKNGRKDGYRLAVRVDMALALIMAVRYISTGKFMPSGLIAILSFVLSRYNTKHLKN